MSAKSVPTGMWMRAMAIAALLVLGGLGVEPFASSLRAAPAAATPVTPPGAPVGMTSGTASEAQPTNLSIPPEVVVAVRQDAPPFVSFDNGTPTGFLWDLCERAVKRAGYRPRPVEINAEDRPHLLRSGRTTSGATPDLLCDPTTITLARMENFDDETGDAPWLTFSPIVFIANGAYVQQRYRNPPAIGHLPDNKTKPTEFCRKIVEDLENETKTSDEPPPKWYQPEWFPPDPADPKQAEGAPYAVWGYVEGSTIGDAVKEAVSRVGDVQVICLKAFASHAAAATRFCERRVFRYFGDADIIRSALTDYFRREGRPCEADSSSADDEGTYEPYALVLSSACRPEFPERLARALYGLFEDRTVDRLFATHFPTSEMSPYLNTLFRINSIPRGRESEPAPKRPAPALPRPECRVVP